MSRNFYTKEEVIEQYLTEEKSPIILKLKNTKKSNHLPFECTFIQYNRADNNYFEYKVTGNSNKWISLDEVEWLEDLTSGIRGIDIQNPVNIPQTNL